MIALLACTGAEGPTGDGLLASDFVGPESLRMEFVVPTDEEADSGTPQEVLHLRSEDGLWALRTGERWSEATPVGEYAAELGDEGFFLGGDQVLPARLTQGQTSEAGVTVTSLGERSVWYGTFPMAVEVEVSEGLPGVHAFAEGIGPIQLELYGQVWELAYYE